MYRKQTTILGAFGGWCVLAGTILSSPGLTQSPADALRQQAEVAQALVVPDALRVFMCGTASPLGTNPSREQACVTVIAGPRVFVVDIGMGSNSNLSLGNIPLQYLEAVLLTHFHSDHIGGLGDLNMGSWVAGRQELLPVMGPEGVDRVVGGFNEAYALDRKYRTAHHGEELLPSATGMMTSKTVTPGTILESDGLKITAFEVDHAPISPAFGYRFDYLGRSVVISGDTVKVESLIEAAKGADLLLHDVMANQVVQGLAGMRRQSGDERLAKILTDVLDYHATTADMPALAKEAGIRKLALYHLIPAIDNPMITGAFQQGMPEGTVVTTDGMLFELPKDSEAIEVRQLVER